MKKVALTTIILALVISVSLSASATTNLKNFTKSKIYEPGLFTDVPSDVWYTENVKTAYELGLVNGSSANTFAPERNITVAETIVLACRLHSIYNANGYKFTQGSPWYQVYIDYAVENGIASNPYSDALATATRAYFAHTLANALPDEALPAINSINSIPDIPSDASYAEATYKLYNAGILTGSDANGSFKPDNKIKRNEVAAIITRMADESLRKTFSLASVSNESNSYFDYSEISAPTVNFSNDDEKMSILHCAIRLLFEQEALPSLLFENKETLSRNMVSNPEAVLEFIDNEAWAQAKYSTVLDYMASSDEVYTIASEDDIYNYLAEFSDKYSLYAYQNYNCEAFKFNDNTYCILLNLADIFDSLKVDELYKLTMSNYVAIVYNDKTDSLSYFLLERSLNNTYVLCSISENGEHNIYAKTENDKKAFVEKIFSLINK